MKILSILSLLIFFSCTKEEFNNQYNLPASKETTTTQVAGEVLLVKNVKTLDLLGELTIPAYSSQVEEEFIYEGVKASCKLTYDMSNFDYSLKEGTQLPISRDGLGLVRRFASSEISGIKYIISFEENDIKMNQLICTFENGQDLFLNKEMLSTFKLIMKKVNLFNSGNEQFIF